MDAYRRFMRDRSGRMRTATSPAGMYRVTPPHPPSSARDDRRMVARGSAATWAASVVADPRAVYVDTETTGCGRDDEVIELAVIGNDGAVLFESLLRPRRSIPAAVVAVHGITDEHVATAPSLAEVAAEIMNALGDRLVVVYNAPFDRRLIEQSCRLHAIEPPDTSYVCAMRRYADYAGVAAANGRGGYRWHRLDQAVLAFGARPGGHRATADAFACRAVVHGMAAHRDEPFDHSTEDGRMPSDSP